MKKKIQETQADAKQNSYEDIHNALTEDQQHLISKYYGQLNSLGFKKEEDVYTLCKRYEFNEKILDEHVKVLITKSREALDDGSDWVTVGSSKHGTAPQNEKTSHDYSNKQSRPYKNRNDGGYNSGKGGFARRQNEGEQQTEHHRKYDENDREQGGYRQRDNKYYQKSYRNEESQQQQEENGGYQKGGYKQRDRNPRNKDFESRKDRDVVYYAKKEESNTEPEETTKKEEIKPEVEKQEQPKHTEKAKEEVPQTEKPKTEVQKPKVESQDQKVEQRVEQRVEKKNHQAEESADRYKKKSRSPKRGKNEKYVYSVKKESTDEAVTPSESTNKSSSTKTETKDSSKPNTEAHETKKHHEQHSSSDSSRYRKISPNKNVEYVQKDQKQAPTKHQESSSETQSKETEKHQQHQYQPKSNETNYQKTQANKNISVQNTSQTSYTPTTTTNTSSNQNYGTSTKPEIEELPKNVKTLGQTSSNTTHSHNQGNVYGQINSFPPGNLQGLPTNSQNPQLLQGNQIGMPMFFNPQQQMPQTFMPPFNPFPVTTTQGQTEQKDVPSIFQMPYIVFPQPNGTAIIQPLFFNGGLPQMMPGQVMPGMVNPMTTTTTQTQFQKPNTNQQFDLANYFDNSNKTKGTSGGNDKTNDSNSQKNTQQLQESNMFYPFSMPMQFQQNPGQNLLNQYKSNNA